MGLERLKEKYPEKFVEVEYALRHIDSGDRIFIGSGCGEPQYLVRKLIELHGEIHDTRILHIQNLGIAPYTKEKFGDTFRLNCFFVDDNSREAVGECRADYTPMHLSNIPRLFKKKIISLDVALIQVSPPDEYGYFSLGINVDIVKSASEHADLVIAQVNSYMPRVLGDSFIHARDIDFIIPYDEPLPEFSPPVPTRLADRIAKNVRRLIEDGATIQVGYGDIPDAIIKKLDDKKHLGVHSEMISDGIIDLMEKEVIDNSKKTLHPGKTIASFVMGSRKVYEFVNNNPAIELHPTEYTNDPFIISKNYKMTAINTAIEIDLTGQVCIDSIGHRFYSGMGGQADFMRGAALAENGRPIIVMPSTAQNGKKSRIVPHLQQGAGVAITRGDIHYVVTEYGVAYLHGKSIRERALALISIAHPKYREWLLEEAKKYNMVYKDQILVEGKGGIYPVELEKYIITKDGTKVLLRPITPPDEELLREMFYHLSDETIYKRFFGVKKYLPRQQLHELANVDFTKNMAIVAVLESDGKEEIIGVGRYGLDENTNSAEVALVVRDDWQGKGIGTALLKHLTSIAKRRGLYGFTADVLADNRIMLSLFEKMGYDMDKEWRNGICHLRMFFK